MPLENKSLLITGTKSGLGKYIYDNCENRFSLERNNRYKLLQELKHTEIDLIVHCAFNSERTITDYYKYLDDNVLLTQQLCTLKHKKFVYISSVDVYQEKDSIYKTFKLFSESLVLQQTNNPLILRCSALLGADMRKNNFLKIVQDSKPILSLAANSTFNFVSYHDILNIITQSEQEHISGIYDATVSENIVLGDIARKLNKDCVYGQYTYSTPNIQSDKLIKKFSFMDKTSEQVIDEFLLEMQ